MTIIQYRPTAENILDCIEDGIRHLQSAGTDPRYIVCGPSAHALLCSAIAARFGRDEKTFETYNYLPVIIDPFRADQVCVLPSPREIPERIETVSM